MSAWATFRPDVAGVLVVGSYARGRERLGSDVDLVVVARDPDRLLADDAWAVLIAGRGARLVRRAAWGALTELRYRRRDGLLVEVGVVGLSWASTTPLDPGTARVVADGCTIVRDPHGAMAHLVAAVASRSVSPGS